MEKVRFLLATVGSVCFPPQQWSRSCLTLLIATRMGAIIWRQWHAVPHLIIPLQKGGFIRLAKCLLTCTRGCLLTLTQVFSGGLTAEKSAGSAKELSKWSSTLQHLLITSTRDIASRVNLVGSFTPSYLKAGCFRRYRGWIPLQHTIYSVTELWRQF